MERFIDGDQRAFDALFTRHAGTMRSYLQRLTGSAAAADDLTQATFVSVVKGRGRFQRGARVKPWLYAIATNAAR
ncbi:MAG: RNA polymerase sigma factor, partial [Archangium sp.]